MDYPYKGCDFAGVRPRPDRLVAAGIQFVARYFADAIGSVGAFKNLTADEAKGYLDLGLAIMCIWEGTATEALGDYASGKAHGKSWKAQADRLGVPAHVIAWYTVDTDTAADISEYERGFGDGASPNPIGIYADGAECTAAVNRGRVVGTWATNASSWSGGVYPLATIVQSGTAVVDGCTIDLDRASSLAGMWGVAVIQSTPAPAPFIQTGDSMGYIQVALNGNVFHFGDLAVLAPLGGASKLLTNGEVIVSAEITPTRKGYYLVGNKGSVFTFGDAVFYGRASDPSGFFAFAS